MITKEEKLKIIYTLMMNEDINYYEAMVSSRFGYANEVKLKHRIREVGATL